MALHTRICDVFGIEHPIVLAGMGGAACPRLVAAVSEAGGLGVLGAAAWPPDVLREKIAEVRRLTDKPFGVDTLLPASVRRMPSSGPSSPSPADKLPEYKEFARRFMEREGLEEPTADAGSGGGRSRAAMDKDFFNGQMKVVIEEQVPVYAAGLGDPGPWIEQMHKNGTVVIGVVGAVRHALRVKDSGVDVIVAQGHDAGGHNSPIGTMALIPQVVDAVGETPVLGAGGIGDGRGIAAALMLGAEGVWLGTAFLATKEADIPAFQKKALVESNEESTVVSRSFTGKPVRQIRGKWTQAWAEAEIDPLPMPFQLAVALPVMDASIAQQREDVMPGIAGQGVGMIRELHSAADAMRDLVRGAEDVLGRAGSMT